MAPLLPTDASAPRDVLLRDLKVGDEPVVILARVVALQRREVTRRSDGGRRPILSGLISDGTATVRFTWWDPPRDGIERGTVLRASQFAVREWQGRPELTFNYRTRIEPASEIELRPIPSNELPLVPLAKLDGERDGFRVEGRVLSVQLKTVSVGESRRELFEGVLADSSGSVGFTAWEDFRLSRGDALRVGGAYVRTFRNRPQLVLDERATVEKWEGDSLPDLEALDRWPVARVSALEETPGIERVEVEGVVLGLLPPSGVVYRCPTCRRTLSKGACRIHGSVSGIPDLRARIVLDDGSGAATVNAARGDTERLTGRSLEACLDRLRAQPDPTIVEEDLLRALFGRRLIVRGRSSTDEFGVTLEPTEMVSAPPGKLADIAELRNRLTPGRV